MEIFTYVLGGILVGWCVHLLRATRDDVRALRLEVLEFRRQTGHPPPEVPKELRLEVRLAEEEAFRRQQAQPKR